MQSNDLASLTSFAIRKNLDGFKEIMLAMMNVSLPDPRK